MAYDARLRTGRESHKKKKKTEKEGSRIMAVGVMLYVCYASLPH